MRNLSGNVTFKLIRNILFLCLSMTCFQVATAQTDREPAQGEASVKPEKKKNLSFEDELVEGATQKPELFYLFQKKNFNYKRLIKLRENFLPEMRKTSEDLQRVRSSN